MAGKRSVILVGGGLANGLAAWRLLARSPDSDVLVIERGPTLGGHHTWCWHGSDLDDEYEWLRPLVSNTWADYDVRFPSYERTLRGSYHALRSADFHRHLSRVLGPRAMTGTAVREVHPSYVLLESGERLEAHCVVDGRGLADQAFAPCAYQKFYGLFIRAAQAHGVRRPLLMDASVPQLDGFRFIYILPWSEHELLVEDTRYSESAAVDQAAMRTGILEYLQQQGFAGFTVTDDEVGVLPIPYRGVMAPQAPRGVVTSGVRAGLFHPTTGYSLPEAARFAEWLAQARLPTGTLLSGAAQRRARAIWRRGNFCRRLNNMLFMASPTERRGIMAQFYRRDAGLIARFYSGSLTMLDRIRMLSGRPPVPIAAGLKAFFAKSALS